VGDGHESAQLDEVHSVIRVAYIALDDNSLDFGGNPLYSVKNS
jgi:hypothetical protein